MSSSSTKVVAKIMQSADGKLVGIRYGKDCYISSAPSKEAAEKIISAQLKVYEERDKKDAVRQQRGWIDTALVILIMAFIIAFFAGLNAASKEQNVFCPKASECECTGQCSVDEA